MASVPTNREKAMIKDLERIGPDEGFYWECDVEKLDNGEPVTLTLKSQYEDSGVETKETTFVFQTQYRVRNIYIGAFPDGRFAVVERSDWYIALFALPG